MRLAPAAATLACVTMLPRLLAWPSRHSLTCVIKLPPTYCELPHPPTHPPTPPHPTCVAKMLDMELKKRWKARYLT